MPTQLLTFTGGSIMCTNLAACESHSAACDSQMELHYRFRVARQYKRHVSLPTQANVLLLNLITSSRM